MGAVRANGYVSHAHVLHDLAATAGGAFLSVAMGFSGLPRCKVAHFLACDIQMQQPDYKTAVAHNAVSITTLASVVRRAAEHFLAARLARQPLHLHQFAQRAIGDDYFVLALGGFPADPFGNVTRFFLP